MLYFSGYTAKRMPFAIRLKTGPLFLREDYEVDLEFSRPPLSNF
jgi:hypothetical protein